MSEPELASKQDGLSVNRRAAELDVYDLPAHRGPGQAGRMPRDANDQDAQGVDSPRPQREEFPLQKDEPTCYGPSQGQ